MLKVIAQRRNLLTFTQTLAAAYHHLNPFGNIADHFNVIAAGGTDPDRNPLGNVFSIDGKKVNIVGA